LWACWAEYDCRILGYNPTTTARAGIEKEVEWYKECIFDKVDF